MPEDLRDALKTHMEADQRLFEKLGETLDKMKDNHLYHIEKDSASMKADIAWIKKILWLVLIPLASGFVEQIYKLLHP